jgi:hypothetical protein
MKSFDFSNLDSRHLKSHGFVVLSPNDNADYRSSDTEYQTRITKAKTLINTTLNEAFANSNYPNSKDEASVWVNAKSKIQSHADILSLIDTDIKKILETILGSQISEIRSSQIALRFSGENVKHNMDSKTETFMNFESMHIDNFTPKDFERQKLPSEFQLLLGVVLEDNLETNHGNYTCFPGSHIQIKAYLSNKCKTTENAYKYLCENGLNEMFKDLSFSNPYQVCASSGSIIIADRMLAHLISAPNMSNNYVRKIVWFRIKANNKSLNHLIRQPFECDTPELILLETEGRCYIDNYNTKTKQTTIFVKPNMISHVPNMFASMVQITGSYMTNKFGLTSVHTCGFLSKLSHQIWMKQLSVSNNLTEIVRRINETDYNELIKSWFKLPTNETKNEQEIVEACINFHHLHSLSKSKMFTDWSKIFNISVVIERGQPGKITMTGKLNSIIVFRDQGVMRLHWSEKPDFVMGKENEET